MSIYITQQQRTSDPIAVNFPSPFEQAPAVLVTPFWKAQGESVGAIETVLTPVTTNGCKISSGNKASNYAVNILAIDPKDSSIGTLGINAGVQACPARRCRRLSTSFAPTCDRVRTTSSRAGASRASILHCLDRRAVCR